MNREENLKKRLVNIIKTCWDAKQKEAHNVNLFGDYEDRHLQESNLIKVEKVEAKLQRVEELKKSNALVVD